LSGFFLLHLRRVFANCGGFIGTTVAKGANAARGGHFSVQPGLSGVALCDILRGASFRSFQADLIRAIR
jgi:hypothetical protein